MSSSEGGKKKSRETPEMLILATERQAKSNALNLLESCLNKFSVESSSKREFISKVAKAFDMDIGEGDDEDDDIQAHDSSSSNNIRSFNKPTDEHNEVCEVCEIGGDLLCCETCTLVYHISCLRPKIMSIPKGHWSCVHCVIDGVYPGDVEAAKSSLEKMNKLANRLAMKRGAAEDDGSMMRSKLAVGRSGRYYTLLNSESVELGKFTSLETIFAYVKKVNKTKCYPSNKLSGNPEERLDRDSLWCTHCIDDPNITICVFCGCQECFGKHDSKHLLLCDGCDNEYHTYCLKPKLEYIPQSSWYCADCLLTGNTPIPVAEGSETDEQPVVRKRGRPPLNASRHNQAAAAGGPQEKRVKSESLSSKSSALLLKQQEAKSRIVSVEAALTFINRKNELSFTDSEQYVLEQLRRWAPLPDLIVVHDALEAKRNELTNAVVNTTISEATTSEPIIQHEAVVGVTLNSD